LFLTSDTFGGYFARTSLIITMLVHIWRLPNKAQIQDQLSHPIKVALFRFPTLADCITSIGVLHESEIQLNNYIATATRNVWIEFLVGTG